MTAEFIPPVKIQQLCEPVCESIAGRSVEKSIVWGCSSGTREESIHCLIAYYLPAVSFGPTSRKRFVGIKPAMKKMKTPLLQPLDKVPLFRETDEVTSRDA